MVLNFSLTLFVWNGCSTFPRILSPLIMFQNVLVLSAVNIHFKTFWQSAVCLHFKTFFFFFSTYAQVYTLKFQSKPFDHSYKLVVKKFGFNIQLGTLKKVYKWLPWFGNSSNWSSSSRRPRSTAFFSTNALISNFQIVLKILKPNHRMCDLLCFEK